MAQVHLQLPSFNAGELSPLLGARFGVEKVASGCRRLRNFLLHVHGPVFRRPGMERMGASAGNGAKSRLLGFNFSTTTGAVLEFHPTGLRVWSNGLLVPLRTAVALPYSESECAELQCAQVNDTYYLTHPNHAPRKLVRFADDDWRLSDVSWKWPAMGDENVRDEELAAPTITEILSVPTYLWPDWATPDLPVSLIFTLSVVNPDLTGATKIATLQKWNGSAWWSTLVSRTWTTEAPASIADSAGLMLAQRVRVTYSGPVVAGGIVRAAWEVDGVQVDHDLPLDVAQPMIAREITVPVGKWQARVSSPATIPAGSKLFLQHFSAGAWRLLKDLQLLPGVVTTWRGPELTATKRVRFHWTKPLAMTGGTASIETIVFPVSTDLTLTLSDTTGNARTMTASAALFKPGHVGSYWQVGHRRATAFVTIVSGASVISAASSAALQVVGKWQVLTYGTWNTTLYLERKINGIWETLRSWSSNKDRNIATDGEESRAADLRLRVDAGTSAPADGAAVPRFVLEALDATVYGLVKVTAVGALDASGKSLTATVNIIASAYATTATPLWTEGAWSAIAGYPRAIALHGGRLWFGGTRKEPTRLWGSVVNDFDDFRRSSYDDAGVSFVPASSQANSVNWLLAHEKEMIIGTAGDEWTIGTDSGPITPTNVLMQRRSGYGSEFLPAILINEAVVFVQRGGRKARQISPRSEIVAWSAADLTVLAEHVGRGGIGQTAVMSNPFSILWAVTADGKLLGMTFEQEQNVFGWHVHETDGLVESVAVVRGPDVDEVWLSVKRGGARSVERLDPVAFARDFSDPAQLMYLDAAMRFEFAEPMTEVTGLDHLNGREVAILGDGAEQSSRTAVDGAVTLETPASVVIVGLRYTSELQPMRMDVPLRDGTGQGRQFKLSRVMLGVHDSLGGEVADSLVGRWEKLNYRNMDSAMDAAPPLLTGEIETALTASARGGIDVAVRTSSPLPLNIGMIVVKGDIYGE